MNVLLILNGKKKFAAAFFMHQRTLMHEQKFADIPEATKYYFGTLHTLEA